MPRKGFLLGGEGRQRVVQESERRESQGRKREKGESKTEEQAWDREKRTQCNEEPLELRAWEMGEQTPRHGPLPLLPTPSDHHGPNRHGEANGAWDNDVSTPFTVQRQDSSLT